MACQYPYRLFKNFSLKFTTMKLRDRLIVCLASILVLMTIILVLDVETMITGGSKSLLNSRMNVLPSRGRHTFIQRHLQKTTNGSRENGSFGNGNKYNSNGGVNSLDVEVDKQSKHSPSKQRGPNSDHPELDYDAPPTGAPQPQAKRPSSPPSSEAPPTDHFDDLVSVVMKVNQVNQRARKKYRHWNPSLGDLLGLELK